jgi:hypothetical protein
MKRSLIAALAALTLSGSAQAQAASFTVPNFNADRACIDRRHLHAHSGCIWPRICGALQVNRRALSITAAMVDVVSGDPADFRNVFRGVHYFRTPQSCEEAANAERELEKSYKKSTEKYR